MVEVLHCHNCQNPVALVEEGMQTTAVCFSCSRALQEDRDRLAAPGRPLPGVEQYDSVPKRTGPPRGVLECPHPHATANFQCMRCLGRSRLCGPCSMDGTCMHCAKTQPKTVDAFVAGIEEGLTGPGRMSGPDMAKEARELDDFFGDDMKIKIR